MRLFLVRHGAYLSDYSSELGPALSPHGRDQARGVGLFLKRMNANPTLTITSQYLRAQETAALILETLNAESERLELRDFSPDGDPDTMRSVIESFDVEDLLVVGHMCSIRYLAQTLDKHAVESFDTCSVAAFERNGNTWKLICFHHCGREIV